MSLRLAYVRPEPTRSALAAVSLVFGLVALGLLSLALFLPQLAFGQDVQIDPIDVLNQLPWLAHYKSAIMLGLAAGYVVLLFVRRFTSPSSTAGRLVRAILVGWKHPEEVVKQPEAPASAPKGFARLRLLVLVAGAVCALGLAFAARADEPPSLSVCFNKANTVCLRPIVGFQGAAYDFSQHQVVRSFEVSGLYELTIIPGKLGIAAGGAFQSGTVQGLAITELLTLPYSLAIGASELIVGSTASVTLTAGTVVRF